MSDTSNARSGGDRVAVIGLGSMGAGMARSLLRAGFAVAGFDVNPAAVRMFEDGGGTGASSPAAAAAEASAVISVVLNAAQTEAVLFGDGGCAAAMPEGSVSGRPWMRRTAR